jgi:hypothetical protein
MQHPLLVTDEDCAICRRRDLGRRASPCKMARREGFEARPSFDDHTKRYKSRVVASISWLLFRPRFRLQISSAPAYKYSEPEDWKPPKKTRSKTL